MVKTRNQNSFLIKGEQPGIYFTQQLSINVLDHFNQTMIMTQNDVFSLEIASKPDRSNLKNQFIPKLSGRTSENAVNGVVTFQNFSISGIPNLKYYLFVTGKSLIFRNNYKLNPWELSDNNSYYFVIQIILKKCEAGSVMEKTKDFIHCNPCENGKFTLSMYAGCSDCTEGGECNNGLIETKPGFKLYS